MKLPEKEEDERGLPPVFLERQTYRRRRMMDAARFLPVLGIGLFAVPLLWSKSGNSDLIEPVKTSGAAIYLFVVWAGLIALSAGLGSLSRGWLRNEPQGPEGDTSHRQN